jgi:MFS family permease
MEKPPGPRALLARPDFRRAYLANAVSQVGDSFQFVAVVWLAILAGGPLGVVAVRLADGLPALLLSVHGGSVADRWDRRRLMIVADLARGVALLPIVVIGITGHVSIWALAPLGFVVAAASSYFVPASGAFLPTLVGRTSVQQANGLVSATNSAISVAGRALAALVLAVVSVGSFFVVNAASFFLSAALLTRVRSRPAAAGDKPIGRAGLRVAVSAVRSRPGLPAAIAMLGFGMAVMTGVWTIGVAELSRSTLGHGASSLSLVLAATAAGTIAAGMFLAHRPVRRKVRASCLAWALLFPGYALLGLFGNLAGALVGTFVVGLASGAALVLVTAAAQESVPEEVLGRVMGVVSLANLGAKPLGLLAFGTLYMVFDPRVMFLVGGIVVFVMALMATVAVGSATRHALAIEAAA